MILRVMPGIVCGMTDYTLKVQENRCRRMAARQGLQLVKERRRDQLATDYGTYRLLAEDEDDQGDDGVWGWYSKTRRNREMFNYSRDSMPRASALVHAFLAYDLPAIHALGPAEAEFVPGFLDPLEYGPNQREANPDHDLVFGLVHLVIKLAQENKMPAEVFYSFMEGIRSIPDTEPKRDERPPDGLKVVAVGTIDKIEEFLTKGTAKVR